MDKKRNPVVFSEVGEELNMVMDVLGFRPATPFHKSKLNASAF